MRIQCRLVMIELQQRLHIALQLSVLIVLQQIPLQTLRLTPLGELCKILSHEQQLLARMSKHEAVGCTQICKLELPLARHLADHRTFSVYDLVVREGQNKVLAVRIDHAERQLTVMVGTEERIELHIIEEIVHPAHVPLIVKSKAALLYRDRHLRPCGRLLCDQKRTVRILFINRIQMLEKFDRFQVLIAAVNIRHPLTVVLAIVEVQHRSDCVHADAVCMVYIFPEQCIGDQEVRYFRTAIVVNQGTPVRMGTFARIEVLIQTGAVKCAQPKRIARKMCRYPVQNDTDALFMHVVHEIHKILRGAVAGSRCIVAGHLIAPRRIKWMLHDRQQLHVRISHLFYIVCQHRRKLPVIVELSSIIRLPPGAKMQLVDGHRLFLGCYLFPVRQPLLIGPGKPRQVSDDRCGIRTKLRCICIRICLQISQSALRLNLILI